MNVGRIIGNIQRRIDTNKILNQEKEMENFVHIHDVNTYGDSFSQLYTARPVIANYAKSKGVRVDVFESREGMNSALADEPAENLKVVLTNLLTRKSTEKIVPAKTDAIYPKQREQRVVIPVKGEQDLQYVRTGIHTTEDNFLRNFYRNIEDMTRSITGKNAANI